MPLYRDDNGTYRLDLENEPPDADRWPASYVEALLRYLTALDVAFTRAKERSEFWYVLALLRVRGIQDAGWDPFETTLAIMDSMKELAGSVQDYATQRHLFLWTYGHLVEASEPYEIVCNMISISNGGSFNPHCFPARDGRPQTPGQKIRQLESLAHAAGIPDVPLPFRERWDRDLRNAIFHADYALYGAEVRIRNPIKQYTGDEFMQLLNRALACHDALRHLYRAHVKSYGEPVLIDVPKEFSPDPEVKGQIIVREGDGLAGVRAAWPTGTGMGLGRIQWSLGRYLRGEQELLRQDPERLVLPPPPEGQEL